MAAYKYSGILFSVNHNPYPEDDHPLLKNELWFLREPHQEGNRSAATTLDPARLL